MQRGQLLLEQWLERLMIHNWSVLWHAPGGIEPRQREGRLQMVFVPTRELANLPAFIGNPGVGEQQERVGFYDVRRVDLGERVLPNYSDRGIRLIRVFVCTVGACDCNMDDHFQLLAILVNEEFVTRDHRNTERQSWDASLLSRAPSFRGSGPRSHSNAWCLSLTTAAVCWKLLKVSFRLFAAGGGLLPELDSEF